MIVHNCCFLISTGNPRLQTVKEVEKIADNTKWTKDKMSRHLQ